MDDPEEKPKESSSVESLYVGKDNTIINVLGVQMEIKELSGEDFLKLTEGCFEADGKTLKPERYIPKLIDTVVVKPEIDVSRLKIEAYTLIGDAIQKALGLDKVIAKNLPAR